MVRGVEKGNDVKYLALIGLCILTGCSRPTPYDYGALATGVGQQLKNQERLPSEQTSLLGGCPDSPCLGFLGRCCVEG